MCARVPRNPNHVPSLSRFFFSFVTKEHLVNGGGRCACVAGREASWRRDWSWALRDEKSQSSQQRGEHSRWRASTLELMWDFGRSAPSLERWLADGSVAQKTGVCVQGKG